jgi:hypothetical protein
VKSVLICENLWEKIIKSLNQITIMKTTKTNDVHPLSPFGGRGALYFFFLLLPLWGMGGSSVAQVSVTITGTTYSASTSQVSCIVSWTATSSTPYNNKIWVIADYVKVQGASTVAPWSRATVTAVSRMAGAGMVSTAPEANNLGFWITTPGGNGSVTVTATLDLPAGVAQFNWCAYAFDYPPNATVKAGGGYDLHGTPPFTVNGEKLAGGVTTFGAGTCITSITDATDNPAGIPPPAFSAGSITTASTTTAPSTAPSVTVANAVPASGGDGNITYQWRRSGNSSATLTGNADTYALNTDAANYSTAGTYYFKRYAKDGTCNTAFTASDGQYTLTVYDPFTDTWTCGSQTWSGLLRNAAGCTSMSALSTSNPPPAQYKDNGTTYGYYYNWTCVNDYATTLCPSPWRVPTLTDFNTLVNCTTYDIIIQAWKLPGYADAGRVNHAGSAAWFWAITSVNAANAVDLNIFNGTATVGQGEKRFGYNAKCVR